MRATSWKTKVLIVGPFVLTVLAVMLTPQKGNAIPAFARKYGTSCTTCHTDFPKLNDFGKAFKDAGFVFPKDDETFLKQPDTMLGAPAQRQLWPHTIWPGTIPGNPPIGLRMNNFFQLVAPNRGNFNVLSSGIPQFIPTTDFETGFFSIFTAGNFGSQIAFWVDDDISVAGKNGNGGLGDGYLKFVNLSRFLKLPKDSLSLRAGQFELDLPFTQARTYNLSPYDIYQQANIGAMGTIPALGQFVSNQFTFATVGKGVELSGGHTYAGYHYSFAVVDQNTSAIDQGANVSPFVPSATGSNNGGVGFGSDSNFKDLYGRFSYRFNLERDKESRKAVQAAGPSGPRDHTYLSLGAYYFYGRSLQRLLSDLPSGPAVLSAREPFYRVGGDFSFNYRTLNIYGLGMYGHDENLVPIDSTGAFIVLPVPSTAVPVGFAKSIPATFSGGFVQADWLALPWIMVIMRYDTVNSSADRINGLSFSTGSPFNVPFRSTRNRFTPGVQFLIHQNIKASFEYQIRPEQTVTVVTNAVTGATMAINPFRTNTATVGLEFVY